MTDNNFLERIRDGNGQNVWVVCVFVSKCMFVSVGECQNDIVSRKSPVYPQSLRLENTGCTLTHLNTDISGHLGHSTSYLYHIIKTQNRLNMMWHFEWRLWYSRWRRLDTPLHPAIKDIRKWVMEFRCLINGSIVAPWGDNRLHKHKVRASDKCCRRFWILSNQCSGSKWSFSP